MSIRLIATDMDGTFLNNEHNYDHHRFKKVFDKLTKNGVQLVAASGSSYPRLRRELLKAVNYAAHTFDRHFEVLDLPETENV